MAVYKRAKRSKRRKMPGEKRDPGTHLPWFVSLCEWVYWVYITQVHVSIEMIDFDCRTQAV